jgi:hypothetical protein
MNRLVEVSVPYRTGKKGKKRKIDRYAMDVLVVELGTRVRNALNG